MAIRSVREQYNDYLDLCEGLDVNSRSKSFEEWCENRLVLAFMQLEAKTTIIDRLYQDINHYRLGLDEIADSPHCLYERNEQSSYGIGVTDGHRYCSTIAKRSLGRKVNEGY